ncbi:MAG: M48 family metalloprotease [Thiomicrorhabdus sp.]|nr:M48 family metalloprotease [Thiomicrorhabdus sp.]
MAHAHTSSLPDLGAPDLIEYDTATEQRLGRAFTSALHTQYKLFRDLDTNDYIRELGHKLASHTGNDRNYSFYIINDPSINAFAGPDGVIGIHTGLILASESEDELAAVIAHEISHVTQNHLSRRYEYSSTQGGINTVATLIAAILIGSQDASAGMATLMGGMGYNLQQQLKNSRQHESEADAIGITLLHKTGYNPHAMGDFFARLSKQSQTDTTKVPEILRTHPVSDHRLAEAENRALNLKPLNKTTPQSQLKLIQQRIHFLNNSHPQFTIGNVKTFTPQEKCYQEALEHLSKKTHAPECLYTLAFEAKSHPIFLSTLIQTLNKQPVNHTEQLANLKKQVELKIELHPNTTSLPIYYSRLLNKLNLPQTAEKVLEQAEQQLDYKYELYMELSENFAKKQQNARAYFNLAKAYLTTGNPERSQYFLKQAISTKTNNDQNIEQEILLFKSKNDNLLNNKDK